MDRTGTSGWPRELCLGCDGSDHVFATCSPHFIPPFSDPSRAAIAEAPAPLGEPQQVIESVSFRPLDNGLVLSFDSNLDQLNQEYNSQHDQDGQGIQDYIYGVNTSDTDLLPSYPSFAEPVADVYGTFSQGSESEQSLDIQTDTGISQSGSLATSWTTASGGPKLTASSCPQAWYDTPPVVGPRKRIPGKRDKYLGNTLETRSPIKRNNARPRKAQLRKVMDNLDNLLRSHPTFSLYSKQKSRILLSQIRLLTEQEELRGMMQTNSRSEVSNEFDQNQWSMSSTNSPPLPETMNSCHLNDEWTSKSNTPRQTTCETGDQITIDDEGPRGLKTAYACTKEGCFYWTYSEVDWRRHETGDKHWPQERYMCLQCPVVLFNSDGDPVCIFCSTSFFLSADLQSHYLQCVRARNQAKTFGRKDHFCLHLRKEHDVQDTAQHAENWKYPVHSDWPRQCGFCGSTFQSFEDRMKHVALHYQNGRRPEEWKLPFHRSKRSNLGSRKPDLEPWNTDTDSDNDDGFDGNGGKPHSGTTGLRNGGSARVESESRTTESRYHNGREWGSHQSQMSISYHLTQPSLALERYLDDTEDRISRLGVPSQRSRLPVFGPLELDKSSQETCRLTTLPGKVKMNTNMLLILEIRPMADTAKGQLAKSYVFRYSAALPGGILWMNSKFRSDVQDSLWDIACYFTLGNSETDPLAIDFINDRLRKNQQSLLGRSLILSRSEGSAKRSRVKAKSPTSSTPVASSFKWKSFAEYTETRKRLSGLAATHSSIASTNHLLSIQRDLDTRSAAPVIGGYMIVERYSICRCLYYKHNIDMTANYGQTGAVIQERTVLVGYACERHSSYQLPEPSSRGGFSDSGYGTGSSTRHSYRRHRR